MFIHSAKQTDRETIDWNHGLSSHYNTKADKCLPWNHPLSHKDKGLFSYDVHKR